MRILLSLLLIYATASGAVSLSDSIPKDTLLQDPGSTKDAPHFSFRAEKVDVETALALFAETIKMRYRLDTAISGKLSVNFSHKTLPEAMALLLASCKNCTWKQDGDLLLIGGQQPILQDSLPTTAVLEKIAGGSETERMFHIDYPRLKRSGSGSSTTNLSGSSGDGGNIQLNTQDEILFWQEIEDQLKLILGDSTVLAVNRLSGVLFMRGPASALQAAEKFLDAVIPAATRQVEITARIYEVTLNDDRSLGVDWTQVSKHMDVSGMGFVAGLSSEPSLRGSPYKSSTFRLDFSRDGGSLAAMLTALKEQGDVRAVSQPRVVTLNNQPALVKVGTDMPYFSTTTTVNTETNTRDIVEEVKIITLGIVLSVTPQISGNGWVTLGVQPIITDLVRTEVSANSSTAPVIDIKQSSTLVRLRDRETVRISGLMHTKESELQRKIPLLGDIPILGALFRWSYTQKIHKELVIFITPRIL